MAPDLKRERRNIAELVETGAWAVFFTVCAFIFAVMFPNTSLYLIHILFQ